MSETSYRAGRKIQKTKEAAGLTQVVSPSALCPVEPSDAQLAVVAPTGPRFSLVSGIPASSNPNVKRSAGSSRASSSKLTAPTALVIGDTDEGNQPGPNKRKISENGVKTWSGAKKLRHFRKPGCRLPPFNRLAREDNENYHSFASCAGQLIATYNRTIDSYECRLQSVSPPVDPSEANAGTTALNAELENLRAAATESVEAVKLSEERLTRVRALEFKLREAEISRDDYKGKLSVASNVLIELTNDKESLKSELGEIEAKYKLLFDSRELDVTNGARDAKNKIASTCKDILSQVKLHLAGRDAVRGPLVMASETKANYELLEEIVKGEIMDFQAELESVSLEKVEAKEKLSKAEVRIPPLDLSLLERLVSGSTLGPETAVEFISSMLPFNQFGTNARVLLGEIRENEVLGIEEDA
ncbi:unnamed protein product [Arabis nemorensis]|uniref:Uncharacterized protein n=1 Tax=Arabis nemorensis TaxID=586526 RepID=A0A565BUX6_9BRAS|nr:unnamed protein product [Arabis nemorensis]